MKNKVIFLFIALIIVNIIMWPKNNKVEELNESISLPDKIIVELEGAVVFPGVYSFYDEPTLREVIEYAGGLRINANINTLDLNNKILKGSKINIPFKEQDNENLDNNIKFNINKITFSQLILIPNITETRAANIILYRKENGPFKTVQDLLNVKYITQTVYEKIYYYFTI